MACKSEGLSCANSILNESECILVNDRGFYSKLSDAFLEKDPSFWIPFLRVHYAYNLAPLLSQPFLKANLNMTTEMTGEKLRRTVSRSQVF
jgi:hypothetical protein